MNKNKLQQLITQKKKTVKSQDIRARCTRCGKQKATSEMKKSPIDGKYYCSKSEMDKLDKGQEQVKRLKQLRGLK